jgi:hypothetical protein
MNQYERRALSGREPAIAKLHKRYEAGIKIEAHFCQPVLLALSGIRHDLPENLEACQLPQPVGQRGAWNVEGRAKCFERPGLEEGFSDDEKCPCVRNDVQSPRDRAVSFTSSKASSLCS